MNIFFTITIALPFLTFGLVSGQVVDGSLPSLSLKPPLTKDAVTQYSLGVNQLVANPKLLDLLPSSEVGRLILQLKGFYVKDKMTPAEWLQLRLSETRLIGQIILSLRNRIDLSVDINQTFAASYPPYDSQIHLDDPGSHDIAKRKAYDDYVSAQMKEADKVMQQLDLRLDLQKAVTSARLYLSQLYAGDNEQGTDALKRAGLNQGVIDLLAKP